MSCSVQRLLKLDCQCPARIPGGHTDFCCQPTERRKATSVYAIEPKEYSPIAKYREFAWDIEDVRSCRTACLEIAFKYGSLLASLIGKIGKFGELDYMSVLKKAGYEV